MLPRLSLFSALNAARLGLALTGLSALPASAASPGFQTLPGHIPAAAIAAAQPVSALDSTQTVRLALALPLHRQAELDDLLRGLYDPADPRCGQFLTSAQFAARFSPTPTEYARVTAYAKAMGLTVTGTHANRTVLDVSAPAGQVGKAFGLRLLQYRSLTDGRVFYAPNAEPQVPSSLGGLVSGVVGLSSASHWQPHLREKAFSAVSSALDPYAVGLQTGSGPGGGLTPSDIKTAYNLNSVSQTGAGQTLALFELDGYTASDVTFYETQFGLPNVPLQNILVDGYSGAAGGGANEVTLDIELQIALAPSATKILVYEAPNSGAGVVDTYAKIAADNAAKQISTSWGLAENSMSATVRNSENTAFQQMAAQGQSIYAAAGDSGANDNGSSLSVDDPASQPYMTGVGGTALSTVSPGGAYKSETTWNRGSAANGAGGGGISTVWPIPSYQTSVAGTAASKGSKTNRNVPDVSLDSDPNTGYAIYFNGQWVNYGGTSCASPLWAAFTALVNQKRAAGGSSTLGFANTPLYALATTGAYANDFHDIADGSTNLFYPAVTGYDDATGLGTFNGANLLADLAPGSVAAQTSTRINAGGAAAGTYAADTGFTGSSYTYSVNAPIDTSNVASPAPQAVYQSERWGNFTYTVPNLTPGASYTLRLHFAEIYWNSAGQRLFNVSVNGNAALTNFDIYAAAGGANRAVVQTFPVTADSSGKVTVTFTTVKDNAKLSGLEIVPAPVQTAVAQINAGSGQVGTFAADTDFTGSSYIYSSNAPIDTSAVSSPAPAAVYQSERWGNFTYTVPNLTPGGSYTLRLHFAEIYWNSAGQRLFNVSVNGASALTNFDVFAAAGGANKAIVQTFPVTADSSGRVTVAFTSVKDNAKLSGLELLR